MTARIDLHHTHIFASDINLTLDWWQRHLGARILFDGQHAGVRNVMIGVGSGRLNIYDQPPRDTGRGPVHHVGVRVANLAAVWREMQANGITSPNGMREQDGWRYVMIAAPDNLLIELFEFDDPASPLNTDDWGNGSSQ
ncbi:MAG: catechol 2,3-dioxygenase-like lactoylglutathione lyase family enzyme [Hyphomicrobiaceae bacterium]|jgi:catechol 2,3-dioxygenase-like lactoylglutathione lyase family enzyme